MEAAHREGEGRESGTALARRSSATPRSISPEPNRQLATRAAPFAYPAILVSFCAHFSFQFLPLTLSTLSFSFFYALVSLSASNSANHHHHLHHQARQTKRPASTPPSHHTRTLDAPISHLISQIHLSQSHLNGVIPIPTNGKDRSSQF